MCYPHRVEPISLYIHIPFCKKRCHYCDFVTCAGMEDSIPAYVEALTREAAGISGAAETNLQVHSIYFGGGTPSLLPVGDYRNLLDVLSECFFIRPECEITMEANPGTLTLSYLNTVRGLGINRLSLGVQSMVPSELQLLGRIHTVEDVTQSISNTREAGFDNLSLDLIYGLPSQSLNSWKQTMMDVTSYSPEHISLYGLVIESGTPFHEWLQQGRIAKPDEDLAADMYEWSMEWLHENEYEQYEISNWARRGSQGRNFECIHNLQYWRNQPYLGLGAGAHSCLAGYRIHNQSDTKNYIRLCRQPYNGIFPFGPAAEIDEAVDTEIRMQETMMLGLRLTRDGVDRREFRRLHHREMVDVFGPEIQLLTGQGLLEWSGEGSDHLRLTRRGRLLGNIVFREFVG